MKSLPIYKLDIDSLDNESGVAFVSLVDEPATERNWLAFDKNYPHKFQVTSREQRIISGPLMVANLPIYRNDEQFGEHYVVFDKEAIKKIVLKFFRNPQNPMQNVNQMHDGAAVKGVYLFESFIIDSKRGIQTPQGFAKLPDGSWFGSYKVDNEELWESCIKTGEFRGFSVEGMFRYTSRTDVDEIKVQRIIEVLNQVASGE